jgi:hypothetical protein
MPIDRDSEKGVEHIALDVPLVLQPLRMLRRSFVRAGFRLNPKELLAPLTVRTRTKKKIDNLTN